MSPSRSRRRATKKPAGMVSAKEVRRGPFRSMVAVIVLLLAGVSYAVYALRIDEIRVRGNRAISSSQILDSSGLRSGERILWVRLSSVERRIERLPAVASVTVERSLPATVVITVHERVAVARLGGKRGLAADVEGRVFVTDPRQRLPVLEGWHGSAATGTTVDAASRLVLRDFVRFPDVFRVWTRRIHVGPPLSLWMSGGTEIRFGRLHDLPGKARAAETVLTRERGRKLAYVDVRSSSVAVSRPAGAPPAPVTSAPATPAAGQATPRPAVEPAPPSTP